MPQSIASIAIFTLGAGLWLLQAQTGAHFANAVIEAAPAGPAALSPPKTDSERMVTLTHTAHRIVDLIGIAYQVDPAQILGPPSLQERYTVTVRFSSSSRQADEMMRNLLAERFKLRLHRDHQEIDAYALEVAEGGVKMQDSLRGKAAGRIFCQTPRDPSTGARGTLACTGIPMPAIRVMLQDSIKEDDDNRPLIDRTGLEGVYDFRLDYAGLNDARKGKSGPGLSEAVEQQLGLKIVPRKLASEVLIVDYVERPSLN